jgi:hypothetical protein
MTDKLGMRVDNFIGKGSALIGLLQSIQATVNTNGATLRYQMKLSIKELGPR